MGDPFNYESWEGHYKLVKLNLAHPDVRKHLFDAVAMWMDQFNIDGLRLDAADCIDFNFLSALHDFTKAKRSEFWLMGEVVHGNYRDWINPNTLDLVTNYQTYKGLYSSLLEKNYFEIAHEINRQFGEGGIYRGLDMYNFVDNHDVDRVASKLDDPAMLFPLYLLLFTMPGIPSVYYGSEYGIDGQKGPWSDGSLRPELELNQLNIQGQTDLLEAIKRLAALRQGTKALSLGDYKPVHVNHQQFAFMRQFEEQIMLIILNSASEEVDLSLDLPWQEGVFMDQLSGKTVFKLENGQLRVKVPPCWGRALSFE